MWWVRNIVILIIILIIVVCLVAETEINDNNAINNYFEKIKKNEQCLSYLQTVNQMPTWRISLIVGLILTLLNSFIIIFVLSKKILSQTESYWLIASFMILCNFLCIYKLLTHWNWHYMCNWGCSKYAIGIDKRFKKNDKKVVL